MKCRVCLRGACSRVIRTSAGDCRRYSKEPVLLSILDDVTVTVSPAPIQAGDKRVCLLSLTSAQFYLYLCSCTEREMREVTAKGPNQYAKPFPPSVLSP